MRGGHAALHKHQRDGARQSAGQRERGRDCGGHKGREGEKDRMREGQRQRGGQTENNYNNNNNNILCQTGLTFVLRPFSCSIVT